MTVKRCLGGHGEARKPEQVLGEVRSAVPQRTTESRKKLAERRKLEPTEAW